MRSLSLSLVIVSSLILSACTTAGGGKSSGNDAPGGYCYEHPAVCGIGGALLVAGGLALIGHQNDSHGGGPTCRGSRIRPLC